MATFCRWGWFCFVAWMMLLLWSIAWTVACPGWHSVG